MSFTSRQGGAPAGCAWTEAEGSVAHKGMIPAYGSALIQLLQQWHMGVGGLIQKQPEHAAYFMGFAGHQETCGAVAGFHGRHPLFFS